MGTEFVNKHKGAIRKCREKQKAKLASELIPYTGEIPVIAVKLFCKQAFAAEQKFEVCIESGRLQLYHERSLIGFAPDVNANLVKQIEKVGGRVLGKFDRFRRHSNQLDVSLSIPSSRGIREQTKQQGTSF